MFVALAPVLYLVVTLVLHEPARAGAVVVPLVIVAVTLARVGRSRPLGFAHALGAFGWGATVTVGLALSAEWGLHFVVPMNLSATVPGPIIEELAKLLGVLWLCRQGRVRSALEGALAAGWIAVGFAFVENIAYFVGTDTPSEFLGVFVLRGVLTPFGHPLFTMWGGAFIGRAAQRQTRRVRAFGRALVVGSLMHMAWNTALLASTVGGGMFTGWALIGFVVLFFYSRSKLRSLARQERSRLIEGMRLVAWHYLLSPWQMYTFGNLNRMDETRRSLSRRGRRVFARCQRVLARMSDAALGDAPLDTAGKNGLALEFDQAQRALAPYLS